MKTCFKERDHCTDKTKIPLSGNPLDICCNLLSADWQHSIAYEQDECWTLALNSLAQIEMFSDRVILKLPDETYSFSAGTTRQDDLQQALNTLPFESWSAFGVANFELSHLFHRHATPPDPQTPLLQLFVPRYLVELSSAGARLHAQYPEDLAWLRQRFQQANRPRAQRRPSPATQQEIQQCICDQNAGNYRRQVANAVDEISRGDYQKVILSRRIEVGRDIDLINSYHYGRQHNTPARSFLVNLNTLRFMGFSPETVVEVTAEGEVCTQPLAGTRALTGDPLQDARLREALLNDVKEIAEHAMSIQLAFAELNTVCEPDSVRVTEFMNVLQRGSVQHLASRLKGQLMKGYHCWHAFTALFPAVTASGIPKCPALGAIARHEPTTRGPYSGAVIKLSHAGALDAALVLRTLYQQGETFVLQAGAGIICQSRPERELQETIEKLQSVGNWLIEKDKSSIS